MTGLYAWSVAMALAALAGVVAGLRSVHHRGLGATMLQRRAAQHAVRPGWVYFLSPVGGAEEDPPAPIKIGLTHRDPQVERLPEVETMSPKPLELLDVIRTDVPELLELTIHRELSFARLHGEWFDRDAVLAWLDHYKESN